MSRFAAAVFVAVTALACRAGSSATTSSPTRGASTSTAAYTPPSSGETWWTRATPCPNGAALKGAAPPSGTRVWCETADGGYEGPATSFYDDGVRRSDALYRNGRMHGAWRQFFPDGRPRSEGEYADGRDVGEWRSFHANGKLATAASHLADGTVAFVAYGPRGDKEREGKFVDGLEHGEWTVWGEGGKPQTIVYDKGKIVSGVTASPWQVGIPECDEYLVKFSRCLDDKVPEAAREQMRKALDQSAKAWKEAAQGPAADGLRTACKAAFDAAEHATASMGCEW